ncbi:MAG: response regulator [Phycisphaerales bacterium]
MKTTSGPIRILCVEDNQLVADALCRKLTGNPDFEWLGWVDSAQALYEKTTSLTPDVVCMDLNVPGQDVLDMIRQLKSIAPQVRAIILSGHMSAEAVDEAIDAGAWGYLSKAEDSRVIVDSLRRVAAGEFVLGPLTEGGRNAHRTPPSRAPANSSNSGERSNSSDRVEEPKPLRFLRRLFGAPGKREG